MMNDPWLSIPQAQTGQLNRLKVQIAGNTNLYWYRDDSAHPGLLISISRDIPSYVLKEAEMNIRDITVDVRDLAGEVDRALVVQLEDETKQDVFLKLCLDLIDRIDREHNSEDAFRHLCRRLKTWQALLSGKRTNLLSKTEVQGLYAELSFLAEQLESTPENERLIVDAWQGPEGIHQDFILDDVAVEVKSVSGNQRGKIRISSEDQLDSHLSNLYLRVYFLAEFHAGNDGESLNAIVQRIRQCLTYNDSRDQFEQKLQSARYIDIPEYDRPGFFVNNCQTFHITNDFPRITRSNLSSSIIAVAYDIVLAGIQNFTVDNDLEI